MERTALKTINITSDTNAALSGVTLVWGVILRATNGTTLSSVALHDATTVTGTAIIQVGNNTTDATNYDQYSGVMFPAPVKFFTAVSVNMTGASAVADIYYS